VVIPFSILDLSPIPQGATAAVALRNSLDLAQHAEVWGYKRFWLAEHHNMPGIASAATSVVIGHVAGGTKTIRVGAGGIMLPNHSPLVIAEQFGTLASLYRNRIDLWARPRSRDRPGHCSCPPPQYRFYRGQLPSRR
jgi:luciferase family oxidoreductase group 1